LIEIEVATGAVIKTINKLSLADSSVGVTCTIIIRFFHNDQPLEKHILKTTTLRVRVNDTEFKLEKEEMNYLREKLFDQYTWRERFEIVIDPKEKPASFPFDVVDIPLIIEMNSFNYKDDSNKKPGDEEDKEDDDEGEKEGVERYRVRFNQKMPKRRSTGINFKSTADQVPDFDIKKAPQYRSVEIQREEKKKTAHIIQESTSCFLCIDTQTRTYVPLSFRCSFLTSVLSQYCLFQGIPLAIGCRRSLLCCWLYLHFFR